MEDLKDKRALITGIANKRSIAFAVAEALARFGVRLALTYLPLGRPGELDKFQALTEALNPEFVLPLNVTEAGSAQAVCGELQSRWGRLDFLLHAIASAKREELGGRASDISAEGFLLAQQVSSYSLIELVREARGLLTEAQGSVVTLSYIGGDRVTPNYNVMGMAKASLESTVRYLAMELGPENVRVNAVSAGPLRTLSASGIKDFLDLMHNAAALNAFKRNVTGAEVAHTVAFLASTLSSGITGQVLFVDGGFNIAG